LPRLNLFPTNRMNPTGGYGRAEIGIAHGLAAAGVDVRLAAPHWISFPDVPVLVTGYPTWAETLPENTRLWSYTMSETDRVSPSWVDILNQRYERVLVPCAALVDVYRDSGVTIPIDDVGLPIDAFAPLFQPRSWTPGETFTFLTYSLGDVRKGADLTMLAFNRCFRGDSRFRLVIKGPKEESWLDGCVDDQVEVVRGTLAEAEWHALLNRAHAFVFASRGEGFGMPPREATLAGLPTIATEWLGLADVGEWGYPLPVRGLKRCYFDDYEANADGARWAEPDDVALGALMRRIVEDYEAAAFVAQSGRDYLLRNYSCRRVGENIRALLEQNG